MFGLRKAINKFKADFQEEDLPLPLPSTSSLRSATSSSRITSDDVSKYRAPLITALRNPADKLDDLPAIPVESADNDEAVGPLQKRSLLRSLQHNPSLVSSNESSHSLESSPSIRSQSESLKLPPILGTPIPADPINKEFSKVSALLNKKTTKNSTSSNNSAVPSIEVLPIATHSNQVESPQYNPFMMKATLPFEPKRAEFAKVSALLANQRQESKKPDGDHYDSVSDSSRTMNGNAVSNTSLVKEVSESLPSYTSDGPMESIQHSVTQTFQPYDNSVIQTTLPTIVTNNNDQHTSETKKPPDPTPITQPLSLISDKSENAPNPFFKREDSIPGDFPLDEPSTSSSVQSPPVKSATKPLPDSNPTSPKDNNPDKKISTKRKPSSNSMNSFLLALAVPPATPQASLQPIDDLNNSLPPDDHSVLSPEDVLARTMGELGRIRRIESRNQIAQSKASPEATPQRPSQPNRTTATPKTQLRSKLQTLQEDNSSDVGALLREAYLERQQAIQTQLDKALAELQDVRAENKRLTTENQSQQRSISELRTALDEAKNEQDHSSAQTKKQLRDATSSLAALNKEKKGWQEKLDSMQHKLNAAERQIRCLDHITRHKLDSRHETAYGQPKRRGLFASTPASTDIIAAMCGLNEEIYQTCVQLVEGLERTSTHSSKHKSQVQKVLGDHLTAMMEDQAKKTTGYNMLLMQTVLEVFMVHWCSSIIEAFYPNQESFADLLIQLSAQTATTSGSTAICGKQIQIVQSSTSYTDNVKFNEWVKDIVKELGLFLTIAGLRMKTQRAALFSTKTLALVKVAYNLRTAMAEKDICGGLEVVIVSPDTPFQEKWMMDAHADPRPKGDTSDHTHVDIVAGTSGIGLQRKVLEKVDVHFQSRMEMELKPKVILARALNVKD